MWVIKLLNHSVDVVIQAAELYANIGFSLVHFSKAGDKIGFLNSP